MTKRIIKYILVMILWYIIGSYISSSFDMTEWKDWLVVFISALIGFTFNLMLHSIDNNNK